MSECLNVTIPLVSYDQMQVDLTQLERARASLRDRLAKAEANSVPVAQYDAMVAARDFWQAQSGQWRDRFHKNVGKLGKANKEINRLKAELPAPISDHYGITFVANEIPVHLL